MYTTNVTTRKIMRQKYKYVKRQDFKIVGILTIINGKGTLKPGLYYISSK